MKLSNLLQNPLNRKIDRAKIADIKRAIKTSGVIKPLVYTEVMTNKGKENMLTDGHHRYVALKEMGYKDAPVVMSDERGIETAQFQDMKTVKKAITVLRTLSKHLQGQHDQADHSPTGRSAVAREWQRKPKTRREATRRGAIKGGAIHLGTIAIPALATAAIIRGAAALRFGVIGAGVALIIYEAPQLAFRIIEGSAREQKEFERERRERNKVTKAETQTDKANRAIKRGDHLLVLYKKGANIGVYLGNDKARLVNGPKFVDVRTSKNNRLKIASGQGVPTVNDAETTRRILRQVKREQEAINQVAQRAKTEKVSKHGSHNQQDHDPTKGKGKAPSEGKKLRAQLRPAFRSGGKLYAGKRGQIHADIAGENPEIIADLDRVSGFVDENNNFMTRAEVKRRIGIDTSEELKEDDDKKVVKHLQGEHDQASHAPGTRSGGTSVPAHLKSFDGIRLHLSEGTKVMVSAERKELPLEENARRSENLRDLLERVSNDVVESKSQSEGVKEKGFIATVSEEAAKKIQSYLLNPKEGNQESVIIIRNGKAKMQFRNGSSMEGNVDELDEPMGDDNYSSIGGLKFTIPFKDRDKERKHKMLKTVDRLRDVLSKLNRLTKEGVSATSVSGLELTREDLQDEMAHPHPGHVKKHQMGEHDQLSHGRRSGDAVRSSVNVPNKSAIKAAQRYVAKAGLTRLTRHEPVGVDKERARRIADAYDDMEHDPNNPEVKAAYKAMADEVAEQYKILPVRIQYTKGDPYSNSEDMRRDVRENNRLKIFTGGESHPLLGMKGQDGGTVNDNFRAVHDYFGHAMRGFKFGPSGEENAWIEHSKMFSPLAQRAMTTETRGQNSWYNFSKENEHKKPKDRKFARQKVGILPDEFLPKQARRKTRKGWTTRPSFRLSQKMDMDEGVNTKSPYKNPEGAQLEGGRV